MIRVVITGSECTGKSTLAAALGEHYGVAVVPEFARRFVAAHGRAPERGDVEVIARGQMALEDKLAADSPRLLVQDTDLLSSLVYSHHYYGACPGWVDGALGERAADLYLLAAIDVPWVADGDQRDRGDRREEMHGLFRQALVERGFEFAEIHGERDVRLARSIALVDRLLARTDSKGSANGPASEGGSPSSSPS